MNEDSRLRSDGRTWRDHQGSLRCGFSGLIAPCALAFVLFLPAYPSSGQKISLGQTRSSISITRWQDFKQRPSLADDGEVSEVSGLNLEELKALAAKGHTPSQCFLARLFYLGKQGVAENKVEADKWALIASAKVESARALVKEIELFMTASQIKAAKEAAARFRSEQKAP
jgi:hypothetical protein